jgi:peptidoglycan/LPS O-acetylase OafA/YrhL
MPMRGGFLLGGRAIGLGEQAMGRPKLPELDAVRGVAIAAVAVIHGTAEAVSAGTPEADPVKLMMLIVNKLCAFVVPAFLFVSGLVLFYGLPAEWNRETLGRYCRRRAQTVLVPYLIWISIYYVFNQWLAHGREMKLDPVYFAKLLLTGGASYHLYFLVIIMQFYAVFPLVSALVRRFDRGGRLLLASGLLLQLGFYAFGLLVHAVPFSYLWGMSYAAFFALGGWFGLRYEPRAAAVQRRGRGLAAAALSFGLAYAGLHAAALRGISVSGVWYELCYDGLGLAAAAALVGWARRLRGRLTRLDALGQASFGVYLVHPLVLSLWRLAIPLEPHGWKGAIVSAAGIVAAVGVSWGMTAAYGRIKKLRTNVLISLIKFQIIV